MTSYTPEAAGFIDWLEGIVKSINELEAKGRAAAARPQGSEDYSEIMIEKAEMLADLYYDAGPYLRQLPGDIRPYAEKRLQAFSNSADKALDIGSPFYMSALLFPEDHKEGEPSDLELFAAEMRSKLAG